MAKQPQEPIAQQAIEISTPAKVNEREKLSQKCYRLTEKETMSADNSFTTVNQLCFFSCNKAESFHWPRLMPY